MKTVNGIIGKLIGAWSFLLVSVVFLGCGSASEITSVPPGSLIVDVRTPGEFANWNYPGAINVPVQVLSENLEKLGDEKQPIIVYCRSGNRSGQAKKILLSSGFTNVKNGGGLSDMKKMLPKN